MPAVRVPGAELDLVAGGRTPKVLSIGAPTYYQRVYSKKLREELPIAFGDLRHWVPSLDGHDPSAITLDTYAEDIEAVRRAALGDEPVVVMGHSIHGSIAIEYARRFPGSVRGVVAVAAPPVGVTALSSVSEAFWGRDASAERKAAHAENLARRPRPASIERSQDVVDAYVADGAKYWYDPYYDASWLWEGTVANMAVFGQLMYGLFGEWQLEPIEVPLLAQVGRYDYPVPYTLWTEAAKRVRGIELKVYDHSGHTPPLEEPEAFDRDLVTFVQGLG